MRKINNADEIKTQVMSLRGSISNCYYMPEDINKIVRMEQLYEVDATDGTAWIQRKEGRDQFIFQTSKENAETYICRLPEGNDYVAEIIHRDIPSEKYESEKNIICRCGFQFAGQARMMIRKPLPIQTTHVENHSVRSAKEQDRKAIDELFQDAFDLLTDAVPTGHELASIIDNGEIWILEDLISRTILGCAMFETAGRRTWIRHVTVSKEMRGKGIAKELLQAYIQEGDPETEYTLWVKDDNTAAIHLYKRTGFVETNRYMDIWIKKKR